MEHLPIFIFEIVLCVFLAFAALAEILFRQIVYQQKKKKELETELYTMVESMKNQVDFPCKSRKPADPQYVDEWFRFKKMF